MAKESSRAELKQDIRSLKEKIADIKRQNTPDMGKLSELQDALEEKELALNELSETNQEQEEKDEEAQKSMEDELAEEQAEKDEEAQKSMEDELTEEQEGKGHEEKGASMTRDEKEPGKEQEDAELNSNNEIETREVESDANKMSLSEWEKKTGIRIVPDKAIEDKYSEELSEQDFKDILANENVPKIIIEPGKADEYLKSAGDWDSARTSESAINEAISKDQFAKELAEVNNESYILTDGKGEIGDTDRNGKIDSDELNAKELLHDIENGVGKDAILKEESNLSYELSKPPEEEQEIEDDDFGEIKNPYKK